MFLYLEEIYLFNWIKYNIYLFSEDLLYYFIFIAKKLFYAIFIKSVTQETSTSKFIYIFHLKLISYSL